MALPGCDLRDRIDEVDSVFYDWSGGRVRCAISIDSNRNSTESALAGLQRAHDRQELLELYAHGPGLTVSWERVEAVLARATELGLDYVTYDELAEHPEGPRRGALALSFDDAHIELWTEARPLFDRYGAKVTFFITRYYDFGPRRLELVRALHDDGHAIDAHGENHRDAADYVEERGLDAYLTEEALPSIDRLRADGYPVRAFAYPFGVRTGETDRALLRHVDLVRTISFAFEAPAIADPCPR